MRTYWSETLQRRVTIPDDTEELTMRTTTRACNVKTGDRIVHPHTGTAVTVTQTGGYAPYVALHVSADTGSADLLTPDMLDPITVIR
jgi:hypothetical protein